MKTIPGYSRYQISDDGVVVSHWRREPYVLKHIIDSNGYLKVSLTDDSGVVRARFIHHLLMEIYVGPRPPGAVIRHLNGNPGDCRLENLAYGTQSENELDKVAHGKHPLASRTHCSVGHPYDEENTYFRRNGARACRACSRALRRQKLGWDAERLLEPARKYTRRSA